MDRLDFTLLTDGRSDAVLIHPITWILREYFDFAINGTWADLRRLSNPPKDLRGRIEKALNLYPCDLLFVHRDTEGVSLDERVAEIKNAVVGLSAPQVPVVPVRMQEAWFLIDEPALRRAAGNPHGEVPLAMPAIDTLEQIPDPKRILHDLLLEASELTGRRRKKFNPGRHARRLGELIEDYSPLRRLMAFRHAENEALTTLRDYLSVGSMTDQRSKQ